MEFKAFEPGIEVLGKSFEFAVAGFRIMPSLGMRYLTKYGLAKRGPDGKSTFDPEGWYPQERWLEAFKAIYDEVGSYTMREIGRQLGLQLAFPPEIEDVDGAIKWIDIGYHLFHRKNGKVMYDVATGRMTEGIGHYGYAREGADCVVSVCMNPYPCELDYGIMTGIAGRYGGRARATHLDAAPCRKKGADSCTYVIIW